MAITRTPIIDDDGTGTTGTVIDSAWKTELYNQIDAADGAGLAALGLWQNQAFNVANFWPGVTAGMVNINCYTVIGRTMFWMLRFNSVPAPTPATAYLPLIIPTAATIFAGGNAILMPVASLTDNGVLAPGLLLNGVAGPTSISVSKANFAPWTGPATVFMTAIIGLA